MIEKRKKTYSIERAPFIITFTDLIYGAIFGLGLSFFPSLLDEQKILSIVLLSFTLFLIFDDWHGEHFFAVTGVLGDVGMFGDITAIFIFIFYEYFSVNCSIFLLLAMSINGIRGLILDYFCLKVFPEDDIKYRSAIISLKYAIGFILTYLLFFTILVRLNIYQLDVISVIIVIILWLILRLIENTLKKKISIKEIKTNNL